MFVRPLPFKISQKFRKQFTKVVNAYFILQEALSLDSDEKAKKGAILMKNQLSKVDMGLLLGKSHIVWMEHLEKLNKALEQTIKSVGIEKKRVAFEKLSDNLTKTIFRYPPTNEKIYHAFCPMAFENKGAFWLQKNEKIANSYFGAAMFGCGEIKEIIIPEKLIKGE